MSRRVRKYVALAVVALVGTAYGQISRDWSFGTFYPVFLGLVAVCVLAALFWTELAPDGDLRRKPRH